MHTDLKAAIHTALAKSSSQQTVDVTTLYKLGNKVAIMAAVNAMVGSREVNVAQVTKDGITTTLCWLTGAVALAGSRFVISRPRTDRDRTPLRTPSADQSGSSGSENTTTSQKMQPNTAKVQQTAVHQPEQKKETTMNAPAKPHGEQQPGELNTAIYNKIVEHPGITKAALIKHAQQKCPDATEKQINKTILNLIHASKRIRTEGGRGNYTYHLNTGVSQPQAKPTASAKPARKAEVGKVVIGKEAAALRSDPAPSKTPAAPNMPKAAAPNDSHFTLMLSDENCLHISIGDEMFRLNPAQVARLDNFLARVFPDGVRIDGAPA